MTATILWILALCRFLFATQPAKSEFSWAEEMEPISEHLLHSKSPVVAVNPQFAEDPAWLTLFMTLYYSSQLRPLPLINTMSIVDAIILGTYQTLYPAKKLPFGCASGTVNSSRQLTTALLDYFNKRKNEYILRLAPCLEDNTVDKDIVIALIHLCGLQSRAIDWARSQGSLAHFVIDSSEKLPGILNYISSACDSPARKAQHPYCMKSLHNVGVFGCYFFFREKNNARKAVESGLYKDSCPDVHLALMLLARCDPKAIVGAKAQEYSPFSAEAIIKIVPLAFQAPKGTFFNVKAFYLLSDCIRTSFQGMENNIFNSRSETLYIAACITFVRDQILNLSACPTVGSLWVPVVEALAEATSLLLPSNAVPKYMPLPCKDIKTEDIKSLKAILFAAEQHNLKNELQTEKLARVIDIFAISVGILEILIPKGVKKTLQFPALPFRVYLAIAKSMIFNRQILLDAAVVRFQLIKDRALELGPEALKNPMHPKSLEFKKKNKDIYEVIFKDQPCPSVQVSSEQRDSNLKELVDDDKRRKNEPVQNLNQNGAGKKRKRKAKNRTSKVVKQEEARIVEVDFETGEEIKVVTKGPCTSLVVFSVADDEAVVSGEESSEVISSDPSDAIISLHQEEVETFKPNRVAILLAHNDWSLLLKWDARDIAYSYLIIGNLIFTRFLIPLLASLNINYRNLRELFNTSIDKFKMELLNLHLTKPTLFKYILQQTKIEDVDMLCKCLEWYQKRLMITHQYKALDDESRRETALDFVSMLCTSAENFEFSNGIADAFGFDTDRDMKIFEIPLTRPNSFPCMNTVSSDLSILALYNLLARSDEGANYGEHEMSALKTLRNSIAHGYSGLAHVNSYISHIYETHPDAKFLKSILPSSTQLLTFRK